MFAFTSHFGTRSPPPEWGRGPGRSRSFPASISDPCSPPVRAVWRAALGLGNLQLHTGYGPPLHLARPPQHCQGLQYSVGVTPACCSIDSRCDFFQEHFHPSGEADAARSSCTCSNPAHGLAWRGPTSWLCWGFLAPAPEVPPAQYPLASVPPVGQPQSTQARLFHGTVLPVMCQSPAAQ